MSERFVIEALAFVSDWAVKGTILLCVAWPIASIVRRRAAIRHLIRVIAFAGLLLVPALGPLVPWYSVPVVRPTLSRVSESTTHRDPDLAPAARARWVEPTPALRDRTVVFGSLLALWLAGVAAVALRWALALAALGVLRRRGVSTTRHGLDLPALRARVGLKRRCEVRTSLAATPYTAITWGLARPTVLLPRDSASWSRERLEAVVLHEFAHVRRRDSLSHMLAFAACALHWFNPAVWLSARALREEAERAADDAVLLAGVRPSGYAAELLSLATEVGPRHRFAMVGAAVVNRSKIESRIEAIVDPLNRRGMSRTQALRVVGLGACATLLLASLHLSASFVDGQRTTPDARSSPRAQEPSGRRDESHKDPAEVARPMATAERHRDARAERGVSASKNSPAVSHRRSAPSADSAAESDMVRNATAARHPSGDSRTGRDVVGREDGPRSPSEDLRETPRPQRRDTNAAPRPADASPDLENPNAPH